jgi:hypothetical protein
MKRFRTSPLICSPLALFLACSHGIPHRFDANGSTAAGEEVTRGEATEKIATIPAAKLSTLPQSHIPRTTSPDPASLIVPAHEMEKACDLIQRLGHEEYNEREHAHKALAKMGRLARAALRNAVTSDPNPEVRHRCSQLLPRAVAEDLRARFEVFFADVEGSYDHDIPGLQAYLKQVGKSPRARALAAAVLSYPENRKVFAEIEKGNAEGGRALAARRILLYSEMTHLEDENGWPRKTIEPLLEDIAAILVAEIAVSSVHISNTHKFWWVDGCFLVNAKASRLVITGNVPHAEAYADILSKWLATRKTTTELRYLGTSNTMQLHKFKEMFPALCRGVSTKVELSIQRNSTLATLVTYYTTEEAIPVLKAALNDITVIHFVNIPQSDGTAEYHPCRIQDVALAFLLFVTKQDIVDYGYEYDTMYGPGWFADRIFIARAGYAFRSEQKRTAALARFASWQLKQGMR